jgi:hypothetical protein
MSTVQGIYSRKPKTRKEDEIWQACERLKSQKQSLTYLAIGEELISLGYKRGSHSDIHRYLKSWKKNHQPAAAIQHNEQEQLIALYQHHLKQMDQLWAIISTLRKENQLLMKKISTLQQKKIPKPRIACLAY